MGLVGLAFDPDFAVSGAVYLAYNPSCEAAALTGAPDVCPAPGQENGYARNVSFRAAALRP